MMLPLRTVWQILTWRRLLPPEPLPEECADCNSINLVSGYTRVNVMRAERPPLEHA